MRYLCEDIKCTYDGDGPYELSLPPEACIDEHNCATVFCPYCQSELIRKQEPEPDGRNPVHEM